MKIDIAYDTKQKLENIIASIVRSYMNVSYIECITVSSFVDEFSGKPTVGITLICDNLDNCNLLINEDTFIKQIDGINVTLGYTYKSEILDGRKKYFKNEIIVIDKKDYKNIQSNIRNYKCGFDNMVEFNPTLKLTK